MCNDDVTGVRNEVTVQRQQTPSNINKVRTARDLPLSSRNSLENTLLICLHFKQST